MRLPRFKPWHMIVVVATFPIYSLIIVIAVFFAPAPYESWYNNECLRLAEEAKLVGRPESDIPSVLGPPSYVWDYDDPKGDRKTYNYDPGWGALSIFQVHCRDGVVVAVEPFDT